MTERSFVDRWLGVETRRRSDLSKYTIRSDRYDQEDLGAVLRELPEFATQDEKISAFADTGHHAFSDLFFDLVKAMPEPLNDDDVLPKYLVNQHIISEADKMKEVQQLRGFTIGDPVAAALADISMEPTLEILFDKLKEEQKMADELQRQMEQMQGLEGQAADLDQMMQDATGEPSEQGKGRGPVDFQKQRSKIQQEIEKLREQMNQNHAQLQERLNKKRGQIQQAIRQSAKDAGEEAEAVESAALMWGQEPGSVSKLDARTRLEFAKKVSNPKFKKIAKLIGPLMRLAMAMQARKTEHGHEELYDITLGGDLARLVPVELLMLEDEVLELDFYRRWSENRLLNYKLRGVEKVARGGIICAIDSSGSMAGDKEIWSKAVALALLHIARKQKRSFYGLLFDGPGSMETFDFRDVDSPINPDMVADFASKFRSGGTSFVTPLSHAIDIARQEFEDHGAVRADCVFITDGICGVPDDWMKEFIEERDHLGFRVHGLTIGGHSLDEPLASLCSHRVWTIRDLVSGEDVRELFAQI